MNMKNEPSSSANCFTAIEQVSLEEERLKEKRASVFKRIRAIFLKLFSYGKDVFNREDPVDRIMSDIKRSAIINHDISNIERQAVVGERDGAGYYELFYVTSLSSYESHQGRSFRAPGWRPQTATIKRVNVLSMAELE